MMHNKYFEEDYIPQIDKDNHVIIKKNLKIGSGSIENGSLYHKIECISFHLSINIHINLLN